MINEKIQKNLGQGAPIIILIIVLFLVLSSVYYFTTREIKEAKESEEPENSQNPTISPSTIPQETDIPSNNDKSNSQVIKTFEIAGRNFEFSQKEIKVKKGDKVKILFGSIDGYHDWVVDEFNASTERVSTGGISKVEFVVDKSGTFEFYCSVGNHRQLGMVGKLIVED